MICVVLGANHLVKRNFRGALVTSVALTRVPRHREGTGVLDADITRCGRKRATLRHPSWASTIVGFEEFPAERAAPLLVSFV
jgi:hypothetical protein